MSPMSPRLLRPRARQAGAPPPDPNANLRSGLIAFYPLSNDSDSSGNDRNLTATNITYQAGKIGNGAYFDGSAYFTTNSLPAFSGANMTIAGWFKNIGADYEDFLIGAGNADLSVYIVRVGGDIKASVSEGYSETFAGGSGANDGNWHFFAVTRTATQKKVWLDQTVNSVGGSYGALNNPTPFSIGSNWDNGYLLLDGMMDAVGIWNRALSDAEIAQLYNAGAGLEISATPPVAPDAPTWLFGTAGNGQVSLTWTAPASDGGAAITDYTVQYSTNGGSTWTTFSRAASTATTATVTGLTNGTVYSFRVAAVNSVGTGAYSSVDPLVAPRTTPGAPTSLTATASNAQVALSWTAPASDGGSNITDYAVQFSSNGGSTWSTFADGTSTATSATVTGLTNGTGYTFRASATNSAGTGPYSSASASVTPFAPPLSPSTSGWTGEGSEATKLARATLTNITGPNTITINSAGLLRITATTSGAGDGTGGLMTIVAGGQTYTGNSGGSGGSWSVDITKTVIATQTITFAAEYSNGAFNSLQAWIIPPVAPPAPTSLTSPSQSSGSVYLTWAAPANDGGSAITDYAIQYSSNSGSTWTTVSRSASTALNATVSGLTNGTSYQFRVAGVNSVGTGSYSSTTTATPTAGNSLTASGWSGSGTAASKLAPPASPATFTSSPSISVATSGTLNVSIVSDDNYNDAWDVIIRRNGTTLYSNDGNAANGTTFTVSVTSGQTITLAVSGGGARWFAGTRLWVS